MAKANIITIPVTIAARTAVSEVVDLTAGNVVGIILPTDNWADAAVTVIGSPDGVNFYDIYDGPDCKELIFNVRPGVMVAVDFNRLRCCKKLMLRSGTREDPFNQPKTCDFYVVIETGLAVVQEQ
jgi:hypothetical protein